MSWDRCAPRRAQKALALSRGLGLFAASERAMNRATLVEARGASPGFLEFTGQARCPFDASISHIFALQSKLAEIFAEGIAARHARHAQNNELVAAWVREHGFDFFAPEGFRSKSLTCVANKREIEVPELLKRLKEGHGFIIDGGYGKLKGKTFRISNMGDETAETMRELLTAMSECL
jgi:aspartate aminotransferase-like enzyme